MFVFVLPFTLAAFFMVVVMVVVLATLPAVFAVLLAVSRYVLIVVPTITYKINWLTTSIVFMAVLAPFLLVAGWYVHVNRLANYAYRLLDDDRFGVDQLRSGEITDFYVAVKSRLTYAHGYADIGCLGGGNGYRKRYS